MVFILSLVYVLGSLLVSMGDFVVAVDLCSANDIIVNVTTLDGVIKGGIEHLDPPGFATMLLITDKGSLWRSTDDGKSWAKVLLSSKAYRLFVSPSRTMAIVSSLAEDLWVSKDAGATFAHYKTPNPVDDVKWHNKKEDWVLARMLGCASTPKTEECHEDLYLSQDGGQNWSLLSTYVWDFSWQNVNTLDDFKGILCYERKEKSGNQYNRTTSGNQVVISDSFFRRFGNNKGYHVVATNVLGYLAYKDILLIAVRDPERGLSLLGSYDGGVTLTDIAFPGNLTEQSYSILDLGEGSTVINVKHHTLWGNVYVSNNLEREFTLALEYNLRSGTAVDFTKITAIPGTFIANSYEKSNTYLKSTPWHTVITYDMGGEWQRLSAPQELCNSTESKGDCFLNLFGRTSGLPVLSPAQAVGLILGTGKVGQQHSAVFFSRDAGQSWQKILDGRYIFEIVNRGGILFFFPVKATTEAERQVWYSFDEGLTLWTCKFGLDAEFTVVDIIAEPNLQSSSLLVKGRKRDGSNVLVYMDFNDLHERECTGLETPDTPTSDYESWIPSDKLDNGCFNGEKIKYIRRKRESPCRYPRSETLEELDTYQFLEACPCTPEDYECDYCFMRDEADQSKCVPDPECVNFVPSQPPAICPDKWRKTQGYRKVPSNKCTGGVNLDPVETPCPDSGPVPGPDDEKPVFTMTHLAFGAAVTLGIVALVVAAVVVRQMSATNMELRSKLLHVVPERFLPEFKGGVMDSMGLYAGLNAEGSSTSISDSM